MFFLWLNQGNGYDYTIGCGQKLHELKGAQTIEQARLMVPDALDYYGIDEGDRRLDGCRILALVEDAMSFVVARVEAQRECGVEEERARKRAQLEKLKRELNE